MTKNVTGGVILLLTGSALVAMIATEKGKQIFNILTGDTTSTSRGGGFTENSTSDTTQNNSGFSQNRGGGFSSSGNAYAGDDGTVTRSDIEGKINYREVFGFVGERAAIPL